jgi:hypothetical protein
VSDVPRRSDGHSERRAHSAGLRNRARIFFSPQPGKKATTAGSPTLMTRVTFPSPKRWWATRLPRRSDMSPTSLALVVEEIGVDEPGSRLDGRGLHAPGLALRVTPRPHLGLTAELLALDVGPLSSLARSGRRHLCIRRLPSVARPRSDSADSTASCRRSAACWCGSSSGAAAPG